MSAYCRTHPVADAAGPTVTTAPPGSRGRSSASRRTISARPAVSADSEPNTTSTYAMSPIDCPRTAVAPGIRSKPAVRTRVTRSAMSGAGCPIHSATTPMRGSERSGIASRASDRCAA
jgi:hypothetical protein